MLKKEAHCKKFLQKNVESKGKVKLYRVSFKRKEKLKRMKTIWL
jgi:hypothetical protein